MNILFDSHCHIDTQTPIPAAVPGESAGAVCGRLLCGVNPADWGSVAAAAASWRGTIPAFGLHPWHADNGGEKWLENMEKLLRDHPSAWVGEAGLDGLRTAIAPAQTQERVLRLQLTLAKNLERKINLHCVKAWERLLFLLDTDYPDSAKRGFVVHSFAGPHQYTKYFTDRGAYFSVGPLFSRRNSPRHRQCAALLPEDRLLLESDAFLTPCRDANDDLEYTLSWLAELRGRDREDMRERIAENTRRLFSDCY